MIPSNGFSSLIVQDKTLGSILQLGGGGELGTIGAAVQHEGGTPGSFPVPSPQVSDDPSRRDLSNVIEREFNGYAMEEIVKEHSVSNVTPSRLEEKMNMLNVRPHSGR
jgi:hypothetical protein